jgi:ribose 5-phosphate isomerase B
MRIAMACDHAGRALKEEIKALLNASGHEVLDFGTDTDDPADLPDYVLPAALAVAWGRWTAGSSSTAWAMAAR